jgi:hypothetical protein
MLKRYVAAAAIAVSSFLSLDARALTLDIQEDRFSCTLDWAPSDVTFTGTCGAAGQTLAVAGSAPYVDGHGNSEPDNALAVIAVQDGIMAYRLRIRLLLADRADRSGLFSTRGQVATDVFFWNVKDCRNAPATPPVDSDCWVISTPWRVQGEMRPHP